MAKRININEGILKTLRGLLKREDFGPKVINFLLGRPGAAEELKHDIREESYEYSLNEVVSVHRALKSTLSEDKKEKRPKSLLKKVFEISKKSRDFQNEVIVTALKKPGVAPALFRSLRTRGADVAADSILLNAVIDSAIEVANKEEIFSKAPLAEDANVNPNSVNIMVGRFQPFTLGHLKCLNAIKNSLGVPTLLCVIPGNGDEKHPFTGDIQNEMYERLKEANPELIADVAYVKNAFLEPWVLAAKERDLDPISWTCGTDRYEAYKSMAEKHGEKYGLSPEFKVYCLDRADDNISATNVRECLINDDKEGFMKQMPECLHDMYDEMRAVMAGQNEPVYQSAAINEIIDEITKRITKQLLK